MNYLSVEGMHLKVRCRGFAIASGLTLVVALDSAYEYNRRLHRDVSLDNIILVRNRNSGEREGRLVDWEFSTIENPDSPGGDYFRSVSCPLHDLIRV